MKYRPYKGYGRIPRYLYPYPRRMRTRSDWRWDVAPPHHTAACDYWPSYGRTERCARCGRTVCSGCGCYHPWQRSGNSHSQHAGFEKRYAHHRFRFQARRAVAAELAGDDAVSQAFWVSGDWLD